MNSDGEGRVLLLWSNAGYLTYEDFCLAETEKVRDMRRLFMLASGWVFRRHVEYLNSETFQVTLSGDMEAEQSTLDAVFESWDRKHACCVPSGICKDLKLMGVSSRDLQTDKWRQTMRNVAATLQLSMADVEAAHSRNRLLARSAFHTIASKYINQESKRYMEEASDLQNPQHNNSGENHVGQVEKKTGLVIRNDPGKNCKGQSALEIFRGRFLSAKQTVGNFNPVSKEIWTEVKTAFESLSQDERAIYEQMALESRSSAAHARQQKRSALDPTTVEDNSEASMQVLVRQQVDAGETMIHTQVVPFWKLGELLSSSTTAEKLALTVAKQVSQHKLIPKAAFPISEGTLESAFHGLAANGFTGKQAESKFNVEAERIARPPADDVFPTRVIHEGVCGELCRTFSDSIRISMHRRVEDLFLQIVAKKGGAKKAINADILCNQAEQWFTFFLLLQFLTTMIGF